MRDDFAHFEILLRTLSLGVNVDETVSSSLTESLSPPRSRATEEEELPDTWKKEIFIEFFIFVQTHRASNGVVLSVVCDWGDSSSESGGERD